VWEGKGWDLWKYVLRTDYFRGMHKEWEGKGGSGEIVCRPRIVLGELDKVWEEKRVWELCFDSILIWGIE